MEHCGSPPYLGLADLPDVLNGESASGYPWTDPVHLRLFEQAVYLVLPQTDGEVAAHGPTTSPASKRKECEYESNCPYHGGASLGLPKFRLVEGVTDNQVYIGDSYGYGNFIDIQEDKPCSVHCRCRNSEAQPDDFVFIAFKGSSELRIAFYDPTLCDEVFAVTDGTAILDPGDGVGAPTTFDRLAVLAKHEQLKQRLESHPFINEDPSWAFLALSLLVGSFLTDREIFRTFGYENLYERGCLSFELWKEFQRRQLDDDITLLDESFTTFDEACMRNTFHDAACGMIPAPGDIPVNYPDTFFTSDLPGRENSDSYRNHVSRGNSTAK
ncbi:hypothetical protein MFIFM68171_06594 [Madurella fahalii]|uniref:Uncharacterized protein n=1 Tax=Madurella fahalii TaxID=1157608 RepID=A0ABQ0GF65_9PEZI